MVRSIFVASTVLLLVGLSACGGGGDGERELELTPSGALCPAGSPLRYDDGSATVDGTFGKNFFAAHCLDCHSASRVGEDRHGAPADHNFDTVQEIRAMAAHIDGVAAAGPIAINRLMPPTRGVSDAERFRLGEWLKCGAP